MEIVIMQKMTFYTIGTRTVLNCIIEPLKDTDQVYVVTTEGKVLKWDNTVTETTTEYLEHFSEVSNADCPVFNRCSVSNSCADSTVSFADIVARLATESNVKYESNSKNPFKTERFLLHRSMKELELFPNSYKRLSLKDNLSEISEWVIDVDKNAVDTMISEEYKNCGNSDELKQIFTSVLTLSIKDDKVNRMVAIFKAVKEYCQYLKTANESKKQSDNKADESKKQQDNKADESKKQQD